MWGSKTRNKHPPGVENRPAVEMTTNFGMKRTTLAGTMEAGKDDGVGEVSCTSQVRLTWVRETAGG